MELNLDCIRDVLLETEGCSYNQSLLFTELVKRLSKYTSDDLQYACYKLYDGRFIDARCIEADGQIIPYIFEIWDITSYGHQFLDAIRPQSAFEKLKKGFSSVGSKSIENLPQIALTVFAESIKNHL